MRKQDIKYYSFWAIYTLIISVLCLYNSCLFLLFIGPVGLFNLLLIYKASSVHIANISPGAEMVFSLGYTTYMWLSIFGTIIFLLIFVI